MITFATAGKPASFGNHKYPNDLPDYLAGFGLNGFEVQCGMGVNIANRTYEFFAAQDKLNVSLHTPYFVSISGVESDVRDKSVKLILNSAEAANRLGAERIVVHSGSCAKLERDYAMLFAHDTLKKARRLLDSEGLEHIRICPETMGKINQLGTLEEVIELCRFDERMLPCIDFGHLNARTHGSIKTQSDYKAIFDKVEKELGKERVQNVHIHFSKISYTEGGEKKHLTFEDEEYGPNYEPLMDEIISRGLEPFIVCESDGTQAEDCEKMAKYYNAIEWGKLNI